MTSHEILSILNTIPTFEQLDDSHLEWMIGLGEVSALKTGEYLFRKGDPVEKMYILNVYSAGRKYTVQSRAGKTTERYIAH